MKWYKHDSDANMDARLQEVLLDFGLEGYGLYWYCLELITNKVTSENITFSLEHDARVISRNTGSSVQSVETMMRKFVSLGLFEDTDGTVTCLKLAKRLDKSMTNSPNMREFISNVRERHDTVRKCQPRTQHNITEEEQTKTIANVKPKFDQTDMAFAQLAFDELLHHNPNHKAPNLNAWAEDARKMREIDNRDPNEMARVWTWIRNDSFWSTNILSISKFREKYDMVSMKAKGAGNPNLSKAGNATLNNIRDWEPT